jgi:hypothetical protein
MIRRTETFLRLPFVDHTADRIKIYLDVYRLCRARGC